MRFGLFLSVLCLLANGSLCTLKYKLCGRNRASQAIVIRSLDVGPMPLPVPGRILVQMDANVTQVIPNNVNVKLRLQKKVMGFKFFMPCIDQNMNIYNQYTTNKKGFCTYRDVPTCMLTGSVLGCPLYMRHYDVNNVIHLPDPGARNRILMAGDYSATIRVHEPVSRRLLVCLKADFSVADSSRTDRYNGKG